MRIPPAYWIAPCRSLGASPRWCRSLEPTYAEFLRARNIRQAKAAEQPVTPIPYATYLRRINEQDDAAERMLGPTRVGGQPSRPMPLIGPGVLLVGEGRPGTDVPRLGDVPATTSIEIHEILRATYSVRSLLSRGAVIDLTG